MTLYKKEGRKYIPVADTEALAGLDNGCWMVNIQNGSTQCRRAVEPATAAFEFAALLKSQKICDYLFEASKARPQNREYTKKQKQIIKQMSELPDKDKLMYWEYDSIQGMADNILKRILNEI